MADEVETTADVQQPDSGAFDPVAMFAAEVGAPDGGEGGDGDAPVDDETPPEVGAGDGADDATSDDIATDAQEAAGEAQAPADNLAALRAENERLRAAQAAAPVEPEDADDAPSAEDDEQAFRQTVRDAVYDTANTRFHALMQAAEDAGEDVEDAAVRARLEADAWAYAESTPKAVEMLAERKAKQLMAPMLSLLAPQIVGAEVKGLLGGLDVTEVTPDDITAVITAAFNDPKERKAGFTFDAWQSASPEQRAGFVQMTALRLENAKLRAKATAPAPKPVVKAAAQTPPATAAAVGEKSATEGLQMTSAEARDLAQYKRQWGDYLPDAVILETIRETKGSK
jgi:hypothetical protein